MNERIRELGREATIWCVDQPNQDDFDAMWEEKFAELIVRECIAQCNDGDSRYFIATHFGIPEPRGWVCPKCGVDRTKQVCPSGYNSLLTGHCPMVGVAQ